MKNGICLLCFGDKSFGKLTYNLIASIKQNSDIEVTVFTDFKSLKNIDTTIIDNIKEIPDASLYINNISHPNRFKMLLHDLSPYENTMYLDVDSLCIKDQNIEDLFDLLNDRIDLVGQNEKIIPLNVTSKVFHGFDVSLFEPPFNFNKKLLYQLHGQFLLFKKNAKTKKFFEVATKIYDDINNGTLKNIHEWRWFGRPIEELTMTIATGLTDLNILNNFAPVSVQNQNLDYINIKNNKWFISICGSSTSLIAQSIGGYCQGDEISKKYINYYNQRINEINKYKCFEYIEKVYDL